AGGRGGAAASAGGARWPGGRGGRGGAAEGPVPAGTRRRDGPGRGYLPRHRAARTFTSAKLDVAEGDLGAGQRLADRAGLLGLAGEVGEPGGIDPLDRAAHGELYPGDAGPGDEGDRGAGVELGGRGAVLLEHVGELHRVAGSVRGGDELLRGGGATAGLLTAGLPGDVEGSDAGGLQLGGPGAGEQLAVPFGARLVDHGVGHDLSFTCSGGPVGRRRPVRAAVCHHTTERRGSHGGVSHANPRRLAAAAAPTEVHG